MKLWPRNPARDLANMGHAKRARTEREQRELLIERTEEMAARYGTGPIPWSARRGV